MKITHAARLAHTQLHKPGAGHTGHGSHTGHLSHGGHTGHGGAKSRRGHLVRHYLEMVAAMVVGMVVLGAAVGAVLDFAGLEYSSTSHPAVALLEMAFEMSVGMVVWMRYRGHSWASSLEMTGAMFAPALALIPLIRLDVVAYGTATTIEHLIMLPLMFAVMLRRRSEYGG